MERCIMAKLHVEDVNKVKVEGHRGTWYVIDTLYFDAKPYFLLEHNTYGDEADCIAVDENGKLVLDEITGGTDEIYEYLEEQHNK